MIRFFITLLLLLLPCSIVYASDCSVAQYDSLVAAGKSAAADREWNRSEEIYSRLLADCRSQLVESDLAKAYDALSFGQLMLEHYAVAIDNAKKCLEYDARYNACMMTAAKASDALGDKSLALEYARSAAEIEPYDDYSAAVAIYAKDFLKKLEKR